MEELNKNKTTKNLQILWYSSQQEVGLNFPPLSSGPDIRTCFKEQSMQRERSDTYTAESQQTQAEAGNQLVSPAVRDVWSDEEAHHLRGLLPKTYNLSNHEKALGQLTRDTLQNTWAVVFKMWKPWDKERQRNCHSTETKEPWQPSAKLLFQILNVSITLQVI